VSTTSRFCNTRTYSCTQASLHPHIHTSTPHIHIHIHKAHDHGYADVHLLTFPKPYHKCMERTWPYPSQNFRNSCNAGRFQSQRLPGTVAVCVWMDSTVAVCGWIVKHELDPRGCGEDTCSPSWSSSCEGARRGQRCSSRPRPPRFHHLNLLASLSAPRRYHHQRRQPGRGAASPERPRSRSMIL
jgi:hypothetical protein